jgi:uncharacterized protein YabE (DUF348 family)
MKSRSYIVMLAVCAVSAVGVSAAEATPQAELVSENGSFVLAQAHSQTTLAAMRKAGVSYHATAKAKNSRRIDRSLPSYPRHGFEPTG